MLDNIGSNGKETKNPPIKGVFYSEHIEKAERKFVAYFTRAAYFNVLYFPEERRGVIVLAETAEGAKKIVEYHWSSPKDIEVHPFEEASHGV